MKVALTKGLNAQQKEELSRDFAASAILRKRLIYLLQEEIRVQRAKARSEDMYDKASWSLYQADSIGFERACEKFIGMLE